MKNIKMISIDLDGTLLKSDKTICKKSLSSIYSLKKQGVIIVFNTGRPFKLIPKKLLFGNDYLILSNGTYCINNKQKMFDNQIPLLDSKNIINYFSNKYNDIFFSIESEENIYSCYNDLPKCKLYYAEKIKKKYLLEKSIRKFLIINDQDKYIDIEDLQKNIPPNTKILITEKGRYIQIMPIFSSKLTGIEFLCEKYGINLSNVLAFGDDFNDLEVLKEVGIGVAMQNADFEIKKNANYVTLSNDDNGIHHFIENCLNKASCVQTLYKKY